MHNEIEDAKFVVNEAQQAGTISDAEYDRRMEAIAVLEGKQ